ncbi:unnamed protein product [Vitrella brassicaformis CCMP3155]|uniref:Vitamin K epoxide reductase domain-containing protein n=3 Tax=Vitrella brassicaformis TaxID=1169539 RepID=A0A0G4ES48_VITBC|nr:unnamed protein product [Vitrella brassicaformis CCMP3155]|eukprot:CEM00685.1 unnamed protein product [Vitrella brassicaformis CCMP3155]
MEDQQIQQIQTPSSHLTQTPSMTDVAGIMLDSDDQASFADAIFNPQDTNRQNERRIQQTVDHLVDSPRSEALSGLVEEAMAAPESSTPTVYSVTPKVCSEANTDEHWPPEGPYQLPGSRRMPKGVKKTTQPGQHHQHKHHHQGKQRPTAAARAELAAAAGIAWGGWHWSVRVVMGVIALGGVGESLYLTARHFSSEKNKGGCATGGCSAVLDGPFSEFLGFPVAAFGLLAYVALACLTLVPLMTRMVRMVARKRRALSLAKSSSVQPIKQWDSSSTEGCDGVCECLSDGGRGKWERVNRVLILACVAAMATFSCYLMILMGYYIQEFCPYCIISACVCFILFVIATTTRVVTPTKMAVLTCTTMAGVMALFAWVQFRTTVLGVTTVSDFAAQNITFADYFSTAGGKSFTLTEDSERKQAKMAAQLIKDKDANIYGSWLCSACRKQKKLFGQEWESVKPNYVECARSGPDAQPQKCLDKNIASYPTWVIDGQHYEGILTLEQLVTLLQGNELRPHQQTKGVDEDGLAGVMVSGAGAVSPQQTDQQPTAELVAHLKEKGAKLYGQGSDPKVDSIKESFGESFEAIAFVDCEVTPRECEAANLPPVLPVWSIDGAMHFDLLDPESVAEATGFQWSTLDAARQAFAHGLADHMKENDVVVYGSRFCIYCKKQKTEFGEAFDKLRKHQIYVECEAAPKECEVMEIKETPSWFRFNDASNRTVNNTVDSMTGVQSLETLAKWSNFDHEYMDNTTRMRTRQLQGAPNATAVAEKLKDAGAVMYGMNWCPYCAQQKAMFGDAVDQITYVECVNDPTLTNECAPACGIPSWTIKGQCYTGLQPLERLEAIASTRQLSSAPTVGVDVKIGNMRGARRWLQVADGTTPPPDDADADGDGDGGEDMGTRVAEQLDSVGAVMYGMNWCPYCAQQKAMFGDAADKIDYVECVNDPTLTNECAPSCGIPSWVIEGQCYTGLQPLERLDALSGGGSR